MLYNLMPLYILYRPIERLHNPTHAKLLVQQEWVPLPYPISAKFGLNYNKIGCIISAIHFHIVHYNMIEFWWRFSLWGRTSLSIWPPWLIGQCPYCQVRRRQNCDSLGVDQTFMSIPAWKSREIPRQLSPFPLILLKS